MAGGWAGEDEDHAQHSRQNAMMCVCTPHPPRAVALPVLCLAHAGGLGPTDAAATGQALKPFMAQAVSRSGLAVGMNVNIHV